MQLPRWLRIRFKRFAFGGIGGTAEGGRVIARLGLRPGMRVADIGSGFGEFALRMASAVGGDGVVFAVDTDPDLREEVARVAARHGLRQVRPVAAADDDATLPEPVDLVFLSSSFHHLPDPARYFERLRAQLRPDARVAILEPRPSRLTGLFGHSTPPEQVRAVLEVAGYRWLDRDDSVRWASLQQFSLAGESADPEGRR